MMEVIYGLVVVMAVLAVSISMCRLAHTGVTSYRRVNQDRGYIEAHKTGSNDVIGE